MIIHIHFIGGAADGVELQLSDLTWAPESQHTSWTPSRMIYEVPGSLVGPQRYRYLPNKSAPQNWVYEAMGPEGMPRFAPLHALYAYAEVDCTRCGGTGRDTHSRPCNCTHYYYGESEIPAWLRDWLVPVVDWGKP